MSTPALVEHFFRHEYGKLVACLSRRVGVRHIELIEDSAQSALTKALETWPTRGEPDLPSAWLFRVANNELLGKLRKDSRRLQLLETYADSELLSPQDQPEYSAESIKDDLLRMLFVCCQPSIPQPSQLVFALKTLGGFDVKEIAHRLFLSEANIYKRISRARKQLQKRPTDLDDLSLEEYSSRVPAVGKVIYLIFTEGYLSSHADNALRRELCQEALRLAHLLAEHPVGQSSETFALLALMHFHSARMSAREDPSGGLLLLEEQDRRQWEPNDIQVGLEWLARSAEGDVFSRYHAEAGIAAEHCLAPSFQETHWERVVECYLLLEHVAPSPLHTMNRAVAVAEWKGPEAGLEILEGFEAPSWLAESFQWNAVMADLLARCSNDENAESYKTKALRLAPSEAIKALVSRRLGS